MVKIQALKLVPGRNWCAEARARATASPTRSSAWSLLVASDRAKARRCGRCSTTAALTSENLGSTLVSTMFCFDDSRTGKSRVGESLCDAGLDCPIARPLEVGPTEVRRV